MPPALTRGRHCHRSLIDRVIDGVDEVLQLLLLAPATSASEKHAGLDEAHGGQAARTFGIV